MFGQEDYSTSKSTHYMLKAIDRADAAVREQEKRK
jgi:hypothetical protein